ncbi:MAG: ATP-binding protein [Candidatus Omnitrophota bacterium]
MNILIIDDDPDARRTLGKILNAKGFEIEEAGTGAEAIRSCGGKFFNLALIDVRLPDTSGLEVLKAVHGINEDTIAIMMTGYASLDSSIEAMNKGAYSYITKPVNMDAVLVVIEKGLEKQRLSMENKRLMQELKAANEKLKELDKRKSAFVANVSHEFKNPLAVIKEDVGIIIDGLAGDTSPEQKKFLSAAKRNVERLIRLVTDLLDISKIEAGKMEMRMENFDVIVLINEILANYKRELEKKDISLKQDIQKDAGAVWADRDKISEVVINLLNNAVKYTPSGGEVGIKLIGNENEVCFEVSDTGPGIPEEYKDKIFDKFERITAEKIEGTGLGLPIAKDIVELHKGRIRVESPAWKDLPAGRQGSRFIFVLPRDLKKREYVK